MNQANAVSRDPIVIVSVWNAWSVAFLEAAGLEDYILESNSLGEAASNRSNGHAGCAFFFFHAFVAGETVEKGLQKNYVSKNYQTDTEVTCNDNGVFF